MNGQTWLFVILEVVLAIVTFLGSFMFWGIAKKNRFLHERMIDRDFLTELLRFEHKKKPFEQRTAHYSPIGPGYVCNLQMAMRSTLRAGSRVKSIGIVLGLAAPFASMFMGSVYGAVNVVVFALAAFAPIGEPGQRNALSSILEVALILYKWNTVNPRECYEFSREATSLQKLCDSVVSLP